MIDFLLRPAVALARVLPSWAFYAIFMAAWFCLCLLGLDLFLAVTGGGWAEFKGVEFFRALARGVAWGLAVWCLREWFPSKMVADQPPSDRLIVSAIAVTSGGKPIGEWPTEYRLKADAKACFGRCPALDIEVKTDTYEEAQSALAGAVLAFVNRRSRDRSPEA